MTINPILSNLSIDQTQKPGMEIGPAAREFEALLLSQILKSVTESPLGGGWMGAGEEDQAGSQALSLAQEQFAAALAAGGGLGLAKMVVKSVSTEQTSRGAKDGLVPLASMSQDHK